MPYTEFHISIYLLWVVLGWIALRGLIGGRAIFEFPTVAAMLGLAWVVPQSIELESSLNRSYASNSFWLYVSACFLFIFFGFALGRKARLRTIRSAPEKAIPRYKIKRLIVAAGCLTALGQLAQLMMGGIDTSGMGGQWTGVITMYALVSKAGALGLCLSVLIFAHTRSRIALAIALVAAIPLLSGAIFGIRREQIFDLLVLSFGSWYLAKARSPSRLVIIASVLIGTVILNSAVTLRGSVASGEGTLITALLSPEVYREFDYADLDQGEASEMGQAQYDFWYMNKTLDWEFGAEYWNAIASQYVPAFLVGREIKEGLRIDTLTSRYGSGEVRGLVSLGATRTGFSDSYRSFWVFGVFVFWSIGCIFGYIYANTFFGGISAQYYYLVLLAEGLKGITHSTAEFFASLPFVFAISFLVFWFSQSPNRRGGGQQARSLMRFEAKCDATDAATGLDQSPSGNPKP